MCDFYCIIFPEISFNSRTFNRRIFYYKLSAIKMDSRWTWMKKQSTPRTQSLLDGSAESRQLL